MDVIASTTGTYRATRRKAAIVRAPWLALYMLALLVFLIAPILVVVYVSFTSASFIALPIENFSLRWYARIIQYRPFLDSLLFSIELAICSTLCGAVLSIPAALALGRMRGRLASAVMLFLLAPISIPAVVLGFAMLYYLSALAMGTSFLSLLVAHTVIAIPYIARTVLSVYRSTGPSLEEAAAILGASKWSTMRHITLPLIKPGVFAGAVFAMLISLDNLPISFFFGTSETNTLPVVMLSYMQNQFDPSIAAIATVQSAISVVVLVIVNRLYGLSSLTAA